MKSIIETIGGGQRRLSARAAARIFAALVLAGTAVTLVPAGASAAEENNPVPRQRRQIGIMEGILDQVLIDSPNFRVLGHDNTHGIYLPEFGAIFTFEASLNDSPWFGTFDLSGALEDLRNGRFEFRTGGDGDPIIISSGRSDSDSEGTIEEQLERSKQMEKHHAAELEKSREKREQALEKADKALERSRELRRSLGLPPGDKKEKVDPEILYKNGKQELIQALLDYGNTLTTLRDDQSVAIAAFLRDSRYFTDNKLSHLVLKARVRDLREYSAGRLTDNDMKTRITEEEY
jgi:hypothetical protein